MALNALLPSDISHIMRFLKPATMVLAICVNYQRYASDILFETDAPKIISFSRAAQRHLPRWPKSNLIK